MRDKAFYFFCGMVIGLAISLGVYFGWEYLTNCNIKTPYITENLEQCEGYMDLYYDPSTLITYVYKTGQVMSPYYAPNGKPYLWDGCNLVIIPEEYE